VAAQDDVDGGYSRGYNSGYNGNGENPPSVDTPYARGFRQGQYDGDADDDQQVEREERMLRGDANETDNPQ
jgi:hypothetical protein